MVRERLTFDIDGDARGFSQAMGQAARASRDLTRILDRLSREGDDTERQLDDVGDSMVDMGGDAKRAAQSTGTLTTSVTKLALQFNVIDRAIDAATRAIAGMVRGVIEANRQGIALNLGFQTMAVRLEGVIGSAKGAQDALDAFRRIAGSTAFSVTDVSEAGTTLAAFMGGEFTKNVEGTTKAVADLAAFMGLNATEAASAMGRAFAGGAGAADILRERGVLNLIKSFQGIEDLTSLTLPEFREAMLDTMVNTAGPIAGATDRMSATTVGAISNMGDAWENFTARMTEEAMPEIREFARAVTDVFTAAAEDITGEKGLANAIARLTADIKANENELVNSLKTIADAITAIGTAIGLLPDVVRLVISPETAAPQILGREAALRAERAHAARVADLPRRLAAITIGGETVPLPDVGGRGFMPPRRSPEEMSRLFGQVSNVVPFADVGPAATTPAEARAIRSAGLRAQLQRGQADQARITAAADASRAAREATLRRDARTRASAQRRAEAANIARTFPFVNPAQQDFGAIGAARAEGMALREGGRDTRLAAVQEAEETAITSTILAIANAKAPLDSVQAAFGFTAVEAGKAQAALDGAAKAERIRTRAVLSGIDTIARNLDAVGGPGGLAFGGLETARIFGAFGEGGTTLDKVGAAGGFAQDLGAQIDGPAAAAGRIAGSAAAGFAIGNVPGALIGGAVQLGAELVNAFKKGESAADELISGLSDQFHGLTDVIGEAISEGFSAAQTGTAVQNFLNNTLAQIGLAGLKARLEPLFLEFEESVRRERAGETPGITTATVMERDRTGRVVPVTRTRGFRSSADVQADIQRGARQFQLEEGPGIARLGARAGAFERDEFETAIIQERLAELIEQGVQRGGGVAAGIAEQQLVREGRIAARPVVQEREDAAEAGRRGGLTVTTISGGFRDVLQALGNRRDNILREIRDELRGKGGDTSGGLALAGAGGDSSTIINIDTVQVQEVADLVNLPAIVANQFDNVMGRQFAKGNRSKGRRR